MAMTLDLVGRLKITSERQKMVVHHKMLQFSDETGSGFIFDLDEQGKPIFNCPEAEENYKDAMAHPERFPECFNEVVTHTEVWTEPAHGICSCGKEVLIVNEYCGAFSCDYCGQWYNMSGQEILPPELWEEQIDEDY